MQISSWVRLVLALIGSVLFLDGAILIAFKKIHIGTVLPLLLGLFFASMLISIIISNVSSSIIFVYIQFGASAGCAFGFGSLV